MSITHLLSAETRPEGLLKNYLGNNFLQALFGFPLAGWSSPCMQALRGREPRAASDGVGEPRHLHWVGSPLEGQVDSPLGPVASDPRDKPHHARDRLPISSAQGCGPVVIPARSSLCVPFPPLCCFMEETHELLLRKALRPVRSTVRQLPPLAPSQGLQVFHLLSAS